MLQIVTDAHLLSNVFWDHHVGREVRHQITNGLRPFGCDILSSQIVDFDNVQEKAKAITPVPGGVGPMTIAMLMVNTAKAARKLGGLL